MSNDSRLLDFEWRKPQSYLKVSLRAFLSPRRYFESLQDQKGFKAPLLFLFLTQLFPALVSAVLPQSPGIDGVSVLFGWFLLWHLIIATLLFVSARLIVKSRISFDTALRIYAYSGTVWIFSFVGLFLPEILAAIYLGIAFCIHAYLTMVGYVSAGKMSMPLAVACVIVSACAIGIVFSFLGALGV